MQVKTSCGSEKSDFAIDRQDSEERQYPMFTWRGVLDRTAYAWRAAIAVALLIGTIFFFRFLLMAIAAASHCGADTCGAVGLVASASLRPVLLMIAMAMILSACIRRARDTELRPWLGAFAPLMLVGDQGFLQYAGSGWAYPFSAGILSAGAPVYALFGAALIGLLGVPSRGVLRGGAIPALDKTMLALAAFLSIGAVARVSGFSLISLLGLPLQIVIVPFRLLSYAPYAMPLFLVLAAYRLWRSHTATPATPLPASDTMTDAPGLWRPKHAAVIGAVIALAVVFWSFAINRQMTIQLLPIWFLANLQPVLMPTFLLYAALAAAALRLKAKRDAIAIAALLAALVPFGLWTTALSSVLTAKAREKTAIAAIPKVSLPAKVGGLVIEGDDWSLINCARVRVLSGDYDIGDVLTRGQSKSPYLRFTRATAKLPLREGLAADNAPTNYILIRFPRRPQFLQDSRVPADIVSPPAEIYAVDPGGTHLVAATYTVLNPLPAFPPMLTTNGWYRGDNSSTPEKSCKSAGEFIQRELLDKLPSGRT